MRTILVLCLLMAPLAHAQTTTTIFGTVADKTSGVLPGVDVTAVNAGTNLSRTAQTNAQGEYRMEFMPVGEYTLEISAKGFKKFVQKGIVLQVSVPARVDAQLE